MMLGYERVGPLGGETFVFLHGLGTTSWMWGEVVAQMPDQDLLLIDLPGHGASNAVPWRSMGQSAERVIDVLDTLRLDKVTLVALSLGGYVALEVLAKAPSRVSRAVISGIHAGGMPHQGLMVAMSWVMAPFTRLPFLTAKTARMLGGPDADVAGYQRAAATTRISAFRRASIDATRFELPAGLDRFTGPLTICCGDREHQLIRDSLEIIPDAVPDGRRFLAEGGGHGWPVVQPDDFVTLVRETS